MEEILASIRRIIADDEPKKPAASPPPPAAPPSASVAPAPPRPAAQHSPASEEQDIEAALAGLRPGRASDPRIQSQNQSRPRPEPSPPPQRPASFQTFEKQPDRTYSHAPIAKSERPLQPEREYVSRPEGISRQPAEASRQPPEASRQPPEGAAARPLLSPSTSAAVDTSFHALAHTVLVQNTSTLEDIVREMLRPMLKTWLDDNLPVLVERLVRAEIERVSRGSG
jgi:cell pole-organizing protein PopZ